ncbi:MAG: metallophosphatase family protein [Planctomycetes bacterium]|nr:metallophosphatase family protein [Planctomycetota bacterium]
MSAPRSIAILGDLHSNLSALEAVSALIQAEGAHELYCVGDIVGYGPRPNETIDWLRERNVQCVAGNHDWALLGKLDSSYFNPYAQAAIEWTRQVITPANQAFLAELPLRIDDPDFCLFHGALPSPEAFNYLQSFPAARASLADFKAKIGFCGHTHVPMSFVEEPSRDELDWHFRDDWQLGKNQRAVVNVGSPGQPRDENPQAPVSLYEVHSGRVRLLRTSYDVAEEQRLIRKAGLPPILGDRLKHGI